MVLIDIKDMSFTYSGMDERALSDVSLKVNKGEFVTLCGKSGCGKTTLLKQLVPALTPKGMRSGMVRFNAGAQGMGLINISEIPERTLCEKIGFVNQHADRQLVTDKVWHEMSFGLENLGVSESVIRKRVAETASFFGMEGWFHKEIRELSGGQKQLLNLAAVMTLMPEVIILDEPTAWLDPIACHEFVENLARVNRELGTTIILSEHRPEEVISHSDRLIVMEKGRIIADAEPRKCCRYLVETGNAMISAMPAPVRVYAGLVETGITDMASEKIKSEEIKSEKIKSETKISGTSNEETEQTEILPITTGEGRAWLGSMLENKREATTKTDKTEKTESKQAEYREAGFAGNAVSLKEVYFRYNKNAADILKGISFDIERGAVTAIIGGNGAGKTTLLKLICGLLTPQSGRVKINGTDIRNIKNPYNGLTGMLPQNPQALLSGETVAEMLDMGDEERAINTRNRDTGGKVHGKDTLMSDHIFNMPGLNEIRNRNPFDLSGGEMQKAALAKVLAKSPEILIMDEPTKGLDADFKRDLADILVELKRKGKTVIMVSHDMDFCAENADSIIYIFDGDVVSQGTPREIFSENRFFTTGASRMAGGMIDGAVTVRDIIDAVKTCVAERNTDTAGKAGKDTEKIENTGNTGNIENTGNTGNLENTGNTGNIENTGNTGNIINTESTSAPDTVRRYTPARGVQNNRTPGYIKPSGAEKLTPALNIMSVIMIFIAIPLTIYTGVEFLGDRKYIFISFMILFECMLTFFIRFEKKSTMTRELVIMATLAALAAAGRAVFYMIPEFKPTLAITIIAGIAMGKDAGFVVGALSVLVSNIFFGQGPWTPWQMFAMGICGYIAGHIFYKSRAINNDTTSNLPGETGKLNTAKSNMAISVYGFLSAIILYGTIMNLSSAVLSGSELSLSVLLTYILSGLPFDTLHAVSTAVFLFLIEKPMVKKIKHSLNI